MLETILTVILIILLGGVIYAFGLYLRDLIYDRTHPGGDEE